MKTKEEIFQLLNSNPVFHLATVDDGKPHVRGMLLFKADEQGILFHTGTFKDLYRQIQANPSVEMCFHCQKTGEQIRISGDLQEDNSPELIEEIYAHPTRGFLRSFGDSIKGKMAAYRMVKGKISVWTMADNFEPNRYMEF
jgi:pyridoxamine 5'-phosphate oxidase